MPTCRFCKKYVTNVNYVPYGVRHYAHPACYLDAGKTLDQLSPWKVGLFPHRVLKERGLLDEAARILDEHDQKVMAGDA